MATRAKFDALTGDRSLARDERVRRVIDGDRAAAHELVTSLLPRVRNLVRYLVPGDADVDDIAQEGLLRVLADLHGFRGEGALTAWVDRIVARVAISHVRRRRSKDRALSRPDLVLVTGHAEDAYVARRQAAAVLDTLGDDQRQAVVLHHVLEMSVPEIADELGAPEETIRSRLRLARARLRRDESAETATLGDRHEGN